MHTKIIDLTYYIYNTQFGPITISSDNQNITGVFLGATSMSGTFKPTKVTNECSTQLLQYLSGLRQKFSVKVKLQGTEFEKSVWRALVDTEFGKTITPSELASKIGREGSHRNITRAAHANKIAIIIPDHRLVPASKFENPTQQSKQRAAIRKIEKKFSQN